MFVEMKQVLSNFSILRAEKKQVHFSNAKCGFCEYCVIIVYWKINTKVLSLVISLINS